MDWLAVGLGNPGTEYKATRHNAGWTALEYIAKKAGLRFRKSRFQGQCAEGRLGGRQVLLLKPETYMNRSGDAVRAAAEYYKIPPERVLVLCDDISLPCGKIRIRTKGSAGGHNGLKSIIEQLGSDEFVRIRLGVSDRTDPQTDLADWVLGRFSREERKTMESRWDDVADAVELILSGKAEQAMSRYN